MLEYTPDRHLTGGLRIPANKANSTVAPIQRGFLPTQLILSLAQHHGAPAEPTVTVGEQVLRGQVVGATASLAGANIHASTSGVVRAIEPRAAPIFTGVEVSPCIVIDVDGDDERIDFSKQLPWPTARDAQLARLRDAGIVGLGGAVYPAAAKLDAVQACRVLVINGAECEPYISCDDLLMREHPAEIVAGARIIATLLGTEDCIIAIERDKPLAIDAISTAASAMNWPGLRLAELASIYPAGGERQLIDVLTGQEVPANQYPSDIGYGCQNVGTAFAVHRLATTGEPLLSRVVTVTGEGVANAQNVETLIGTPIAELIAHCGGYREGVTRLIHGGSMMGYSLSTDALPITKGSNCIIAATAAEVRTDYTEWVCIRCGECASACPVRLQPQDLLIAARVSDYAVFDQFGLTECIECGCCDVVCPSHIPLTEIFRKSKLDCSAHQKELAFSAASEQRYLEREERHRIDAEQGKRRNTELIREIRAGDSKAAIRAAVERARRRHGPDSDSE
jgi:electron transport complex protein RnfC